MSVTETACVHAWVCACVCGCVHVCGCVRACVRARVIAVPKVMRKVSETACSDLHLVIDAYEVALTSRFPPTRQLVGIDARFFFRVLWNLPDPLTDWILFCVATQLQKD